MFLKDSHSESIFSSHLEWFTKITKSSAQTSPNFEDLDYYITIYFSTFLIVVAIPLCTGEYYSAMKKFFSHLQKMDGTGGHDNKWN